MVPVILGVAAVEVVGMAFWGATAGLLGVVAVNDIRITNMRLKIMAKDLGEADKKESASLYERSKDRWTVIKNKTADFVQGTAHKDTVAWKAQLRARAEAIVERALASHEEFRPGCLQDDQTRQDVLRQAAVLVEELYTKLVAEYEANIK